MNNTNRSILKEEQNKMNVIILDTLEKVEKKKNIFDYKPKFYYLKFSKYLNRIILIIIIIIQYFLIHKINKYRKDYFQENRYDVNFKYEDYDKNIITDKIKKDSGWLLGLNEAYFINGLIRKNKVKNCLEIGVANGGSAILILNALKDRDNSMLVSLDLNKELFNDPNKTTGYRVNKYFPELTKNWKLYTGKQPHKFLIELNMKFDFLFLDSTHASPGEIINFIESLPFLKENAIVVIHDLLWHFFINSNMKFYPSCISLIPALYGDKAFPHNIYGEISNIGAVFLYSNQKNHFIDYFLLLLNFWEYIPKDEQINFYKDIKYINTFNLAVRLNKEAINRTNYGINKNLYEKKKILISLGTKWNKL